MIDQVADMSLEWAFKTFGPWGLMGGSVFFGCRAGARLLVGIGERFLSLSTRFAEDVKIGMEKIEAAIRSQELKVAVMQERLEQHGQRIDHLATLVQQRDEREEKTR